MIRRRELRRVNGEVETILGPDHRAGETSHCSLNSWVLGGGQVKIVLCSLSCRGKIFYFATSCPASILIYVLHRQHWTEFSREGESWLWTDTIPPWQSSIGVFLPLYFRFPTWQYWPVGDVGKVRGVKNVVLSIVERRFWPRWSKSEMWNLFCKKYSTCCLSPITCVRQPWSPQRESPWTGWSCDGTTVCAPNFLAAFLGLGLDNIVGLKYLGFESHFQLQLTHTLDSHTGARYAIQGPTNCSVYNRTKDRRHQKGSWKHLFSTKLFSTQALNGLWWRTGRIWETMNFNNDFARTSYQHLHGTSKWPEKYSHCHQFKTVLRHTGKHSETKLKE